MPRATVHDVAAAAKVSLATVDRVLNARKGVSAATAERVHAAIAKLGFQRDVFAASLAKSREYRFLFVLPDAEANTFLVNLWQQVTRVQVRDAAQRVRISAVHYKGFDGQDLCRVLGAIDAGSCMGLAVLAIDAPRVREAIDGLIAKGIGVVALVSDVTPCRRLHCIGINNIAAGRVAAHLIGRLLAGRGGKVALLAGAMTVRNHAERRLGFEQILTAEFPGLRTLPVIEGYDDSRITVGQIRALLAATPDLAAIYSIGAGNRGLIEALEESGRQHDIIVVAHELTPHSRHALISGTIDAVIAQDAAAEVERAVEALKAHVDGQSGYAPAPIGIDIFFRDNLP